MLTPFSAVISQTAGGDQKREEHRRVARQTRCNNTRLEYRGIEGKIMVTPRGPLPNTLAYHEARDALPESLRNDFDVLVEMYRYYAFIHYTRPVVSYKILADLIRNGWRPRADPLPGCASPP
jgi:hypothetical protein